jgi:NADPH:quinone reductase-like Zn-dependent oxidoreductase
MPQQERDSMKAIAYYRYGPPDVLEYVDLEKPVPGDDEVLIRVRAASINPYDWRMMEGEPFVVRLLFGLRKPRHPRSGVDVAGEVEAVGRNVTRFKPGDAVFGSCRGSFAEYVVAPERALATKPENLTFEQAGSVAVAAFTALQGLRRGKIQAGQKVLINGAAGGVGTFAVQIAKSHGAEVTGVCSTSKADMVHSIGADHVIDYTKDDYLNGSRRYDLIFDGVGNAVPRFRRALTANGICVGVGAPHERVFAFMLRAIGAALSSTFRKQKLVFAVAKSTPEDLAILRELMKSGKVTPVIDRCYDLKDVADAVRYQEKGHAAGKVVLTVA